MPQTEHLTSPKSARTLSTGAFSVGYVFLSLVAHKVLLPELGLLVFNLQPLLELSLFLFNYAFIFYVSSLLNFYDNLETWIDSNKNEIFME